MKPLMSHSFRMTENEETFKLAKLIHAEDSDVWIELKNVYFTVGIFNIRSRTYIQHGRSAIDGGPPFLLEKRHWIEPGRYPIDYFVNFFKNMIANGATWLKIDIDHATSKITLTLTSPYILRLGTPLLKILGFKSQPIGGVTVGYYKINPKNVLYLHCEQIKTENNFLNGSPSDLLSVIQIVGNNNSSSRFYELIYSKFNGKMKRLVNDQINELTFSIRDYEGKIVNNRGKEFFLNLDIYSFLK